MFGIKLFTIGESEPGAFLYEWTNFTVLTFILAYLVAMWDRRITIEMAVY